MVAWDKILPHRLLVNRSLRKASEGLRSRIDEYQLEYDREIERCKVEIEQAKADKDRNFENVKLSLLGELSKDSELFDCVQDGVLKYVDIYLSRQCLNKIRDIKTLEKQTLVEYGDFLTKQMGLIGEEIDILEERKDKLALQAKVDDVIELIGLSGCELVIGSNDDAQTLIVKVSELLNTCDSSDGLTKCSLLRLSKVLQERVDFLPIIQYISWTIQQKKQFSRQMSSQRRKISSNINNKTDELRQVSEKLDSLNKSLEEQAIVVRDYWAVPLTQLNVQISSMYAKRKALQNTIKTEKSEQDRLFNELNETNERLQRMMDEHSNDSNTWERLQCDKEYFKDEISSSKNEVSMAYKKINQLKTEIDLLKSKRQQWFDRRQMVYTLCMRNSVFLISDNNLQESDECRIINKRLEELYRIEEAKLAKQHFEEESARIQQQKKEKVADITSQIEIAIKKQAEKHIFFNKASSKLSSRKRSDTRFFLLKLFSETDEVRIAKQTLQVAEKQKKNADNCLSKLKAELNKVISDFDAQIESSRPIIYRPTAKEKEEIQQLENRKTELLNKRSKNNQRKAVYNDN